MAGRGFGFEFDSIGNRTKSKTDDRETTYRNNELNQIKSRTTPGKAEVSGFAPTASTVQANSQPVTRQGDYYHKAVDINNSTSAVNASVTVSSTTPSENKIRRVFLAKGTLVTADEWQYDDDGNLTRDDQWSYTWDAENRLIAMQTRAEIIGTIVASGDARRVEFTYDFLGRRVQKLVRSGWNGSIFSNTDSNTKFIYDGWNLIAEYNALSTWTLVRNYTWGLDLSGSGQGAGGVGGLLMTHDIANSIDVLYAYDGNGNVVAGINRTSGVVVAEYEYGPSGEPIRSTGSYAQINPFRFSTKWTDNETGLVYYGRRFYDPKTGRWLGRDPIEEQGGLHLYGFCGNDGINCWDYLGMNWWETSVGGFLACGWAAEFYGWVTGQPVNPRSDNGGGSSIGITITVSGGSSGTSATVSTPTGAPAIITDPGATTAPTDPGTASAVSTTVDVTGTNTPVNSGQITFGSGITIGDPVGPVAPAITEAIEFTVSTGTSTVIPGAGASGGGVSLPATTPTGPTQTVTPPTDVTPATSVTMPTTVTTTTPTTPTANSNPVTDGPNDPDPQTPNPNPDPPRPGARPTMSGPSNVGYGGQVVDAGSGVALGILERFGWEVGDGMTGNPNIDLGRSAGRVIAAIPNAIKSIVKGGVKELIKLGAKSAGREKGKRLKSDDNKLEQLKEIEEAQRRVRQGKSKQIIDQIEKSEQNAKKQLKDISRDPSIADEL